MFITDRTGASPRQILIDNPGFHNHYPVWSKDGQWIYFVRGFVTTNNMDLWRISPKGGEPERLTQHNSEVSSPAPLDLRTIVYVARDRDGSWPWLWALDVNRKTTHRISFGLEKYASVAASADGRHLVATEESPIPSLWSVPILNRVAEERDAKPYPVGTVRALGPRFGGTSLFYLSSRGTGDGLWRFQDGQSTEIWKGSDGALLDPPAVSGDGRRVAIALGRNGKLTLHLATAEGSEFRPLGESIDISGAADWSRDAQWIVAGGTDTHGPGVFKIPVIGSMPVRLTKGQASNPVWAPAGNLIVYAGENVGFFAPLLAVRPDGTPVKLPSTQVLREGVRARFLADGSGLVYMQGLPSAQNLWLLDLATMNSRELTRLDNAGAIRSFDISPDGKIVFDRLRGNSHVVLIDIPGDPQKPLKSGDWRIVGDAGRKRLGCRDRDRWPCGVICGIAMAVAAMALVRAQAQDLRPVRFSGVINEYSPSTVAGGPYEVRGDWSLDVQRGATANFLADLNMETSDYGITGATQADPANPATRSPHTHHISMTNATVSYNASACPANSPPTTVSGLMVTATAPTTANGGPAPFDPNNTSTLQVCIMGGSGVSYSNVTLVYSGPATTHFGAQPIHGVVRSVSTN